MSNLVRMRPRLAELCGLVRSKGIVDDFYTDKGIFAFGANDNYRQVWRPDFDAAQAIRCLEAMRPAWDIEIFIFEDWVVTLQLKNLNTKKTQEADTSLPRAICLAIAAALGWEDPK